MGNGDFQFEHKENLDVTREGKDESSSFLSVASDVILKDHHLISAITGNKSPLSTTSIDQSNSTSLTYKVIDLEGKYVLPGLIDSHIHVDYMGLFFFGRVAYTDAILIKVHD